jgi:hypothetical protein
VAQDVFAVALPPDLGPGENIKGRAAGASWTTLLPRPRAASVLLWAIGANLKLGE